MKAPPTFSREFFHALVLVQVHCYIYVLIPTNQRFGAGSICGSWTLMGRACRVEYSVTLNVRHQGNIASRYGSKTCKKRIFRRKREEDQEEEAWKPAERHARLVRCGLFQPTPAGDVGAEYARSSCKYAQY